MQGNDDIWNMINNIYETWNPCFLYNVVKKNFMIFQNFIGKEGMNDIYEYLKSIYAELFKFRKFQSNEFLEYEEIK